MKNFMVANLTKKRYSEDNITHLLKAQIENSLNMGWNSNDIILLSNFDFTYMGIEAIQAKLNNFCYTGSKMFGIKYLFDNNITDDVVWAHDLDAWQNAPFTCPEFEEVGIARYSNDRFNGGSVFWKPSSKDIINAVIEVIIKDKTNKEEPTLNRILKSKEYKKRITILNNTFNVGCSGYVKRWARSSKPILVCHFHPTNRLAWETHALDRNGVGQKGVTKELESLIRKYYHNLATELSEDGKKAQAERSIKYKDLISTSQN